MDGAMYHVCDGQEMGTKFWSTALETENTLRTWRKCESDIQNNLTGMGIEGLDQINLTQNGDQWRDFVCGKEYQGLFLRSCDRASLQISL